MHIAAAFPLALDESGLDQDVLDRERQIAAEKAAESGKPADIIAKMVDGAVKKFAKENALLSQLFVIDNKTPIADVVAKAGKAAGTTIRSEEHTSELQSLMRISYAVFCLNKNKNYTLINNICKTN